MTVNNDIAYKTYVVTSGQTEFTVDFFFPKDEDLVVYLTPYGDTPDDTRDLLTLITDYTVTGAGDPSGGVVTLVSGAIFGDVVNIRRYTSPDRLENFSVGNFTGTELDNQLDKLTIINNDTSYITNNRTPHYQDTAILTDVDTKIEKLGALQTWRMNSDATEIEGFELDSETNSAVLKSELASHSPGEGASMIGLEDRSGWYNDKTVEDHIEDPVFIGTERLKLPSGTTAQRPEHMIGNMRFNSDLNLIEFSDGTNWINVGSTASLSSVVFFVNKGGNDTLNTGRSIESPFLTIPKAITEANAFGSDITIFVTDAGTYDSALEFTVNNVDLYAPMTTLTNSAGAGSSVITSSVYTHITCHKIDVAADSYGVTLLNGAEIELRYHEMAIAAGSSIGIRATGTSILDLNNDYFTIGAGAIGICNDNITVSASMLSIYLDGNNAIGVEGTGSTSIVINNVSKGNAAYTGTQGFVSDTAGEINIIANSIEADTALTTSGGPLTGGHISCRANNILGTITNNGIMSYDIPGYVYTMHNAGAIYDENQNEQIEFNTVASAVNYLAVTNAATGQQIIISSSGNDATAGMDINSKENGVIRINGNIIPNVPSFVNYFSFVTAVTGGNPYISVSGADTNVGLNITTKGTGSVLINNRTRVNTVASAVNYVDITEATTENYPTIAADGTDTNIDLELKGKGTGVVIVDKTEFPGTVVADREIMIGTAAGTTAFEHVNSVVPNPNLLIGSDFNINPRTYNGYNNISSTSIVPNNDETYIMDNVFLVSDGNDIVDIVYRDVVSSIPVNIMGTVVNTADKKYGFMIPIDYETTQYILNSGTAGEAAKVSISFRANNESGGTDIPKFRVGLLSWTGGANSLLRGKSVIGAWNNNTTNPTPVAGFAYENTPSTITITSSTPTIYTVEDIEITTANVDNLVVFIWSNETSDNEVTTQFQWVKLEKGSYATEFVPRQKSEEEALCQQYVESSYNYNVPIGTATGDGAVKFNSSGGSNYIKVISQSYNTMKNNDTSANIDYTLYDLAGNASRITTYDSTATATNNVAYDATNTSANSKNITVYSNATSATGIAFHYLVDASL